MIPYQPTRIPRAVVRWRHGSVPVIGLTGGIRSGKSEVAGLLRANGAVVIDADAVGHALLGDPQVRSKIVERFGTGVLAAATTGPAAVAIDRRALGAIVFADAVARHDLELILHPPMRAGFVAAIERAERPENATRSLIVLDAAILLEAGWDDLCDLIVFVDAPRDERLLRVERGRGWARATFDAREEAQWPCVRKRSRADLVITNDAGIETLRHEVQRVLAHVAELTCPMIDASN